MNNIVEPVLKLYLSFFVLVGLVNSARDLKKKKQSNFFFFLFIAILTYTKSLIDDV